MRTALTFLLLLTLSLSQAQETKPESILTAPEGWRPEVINLPLEFAPSIDYSGFEDVRFAPGWADVNAKDYFTYTFTWVLNKNPKLNQEKLEAHMKAYFDGLMTAVSERNDLPKTEATFNFSKAKRDFAASGTIRFYEAFFGKEMITLQVQVVGKQCKKAGKYLVRFDFSPSSDESIWKKFSEVKLKIDCGN